MIAVIQYNAGNVQSVLFALERMGVEAVLTSDPQLIRSASKVIFPGVGEASTTMGFLKESGLDQVIKGLTQPVLGICLGMQLLCRHSEENNVDCLGIIPQEVRLFRPQNGEKVPHTGWNSLHLSSNSWLGTEMENAYVYFVHSYYVQEGPYTSATTDYILPFSAALQKDNFFATQFHPEKSGPVGQQILEKFLTL
jgi:glutamine amidotransferase